jgi:hypothetical protein
MGDEVPKVTVHPRVAGQSEAHSNPLHDLTTVHPEPSAPPSPASRDLGSEMALDAVFGSMETCVDEVPSDHDSIYGCEDREGGPRFINPGRTRTDPVHLLDVGLCDPLSDQHSGAVNPGPILIRPPPLDQFGLAFNKDVGVLVCTTCRIGLHPNEWHGHMEATHKIAFNQLRKAFNAEYHLLLGAIEGLHPGDPLTVRDQMAGLAPVEGIRVRQGFYCPVQIDDGSMCDWVVGTMGTLNTHLSTVHKDVSGKPPASERQRYTCDYQTIFDGKHKRYFRVSTGCSRGSTGGTYEAFLQRFKSSARHAAQTDELDTRGRPSMLRVTNWDIFVSPHRNNPIEVVGLVAFPTFRKSKGNDFEKVLCSLEHVSAAWGRKVFAFWQGSTPPIRRLLGAV